ncbi:MAG: hypothetical protein AAF067_11740 [Pseudomonadota bacterium]
MDPNYPDIKYPYPAKGYDWEPRSGRGSPGLHGPEPTPETLLIIAKAAWQQMEIRENFLAEANYEGPILDDGKFAIEPAVGADMLDYFYAGHVQRHYRKADYTLGGIWRMTQLMQAWAIGQMPVDDELAALEILTPAEPVTPPRSRGEYLWRAFRLVLILLLLGFLAMMYFGVIKV